MDRRNVLKTFGGAAFGGALLSGVAGAKRENHIVPGGPWVTENEPRKVEAFRDYEELVSDLEKVARTSAREFSLESVGTSNRGRDIHLARVGSGDTDVMFVTQQHGNEPHGTEAALSMLQYLSSGSGEADDLLDEVTVNVIPRANPDGSEPDLFQRYNVDPDAPARDTEEGFFTSFDAGVGWDVNRYHWPDWTESTLYQNRPDEYPENPVPEAQAVVDAVAEVDPLWVVDVHNQGTYVTDDGRMITTSLYWPIAEGVPADAQDLSKQLVRHAYDHVSRFGYAEASQYPGGTYPGIARNSYGLQGYGSVLVEIRGGVDQKSNGKLSRLALEIMASVVDGTADESVFEVDPDDAEEIPERGDYYDRELPPE
ncbi:M14 family zinc carboxypeptidase [Halegenticoccus tardaugens]|uniref:M14 family zinc carboxypeptidase n=1 Tax=Halegenticoccus tardaugens TaxID=2071624 RepID=UPI0013E95A05|nr:M14 family zinc carboxypeptidase [Halegenticoccus tardaugens]